MALELHSCCRGLRCVHWRQTVGQRRPAARRGAAHSGSDSARAFKLTLNVRVHRAYLSLSLSLSLSPVMITRYIDKSAESIIQLAIAVVFVVHCRVLCALCCAAIQPGGVLQAADGGRGPRGARPRVQQRQRAQVHRREARPARQGPRREYASSSFFFPPLCFLLASCSWHPAGSIVLVLIEYPRILVGSFRIIPYIAFTIGYRILHHFVLLSAKSLLLHWLASKFQMANCGWSILVFKARCSLNGAFAEL